MSSGLHVEFAQANSHGIGKDIKKATKEISTPAPVGEGEGYTRTGQQPHDPITQEKSKQVPVSDGPVEAILSQPPAPTEVPERGDQGAAFGKVQTIRGDEAVQGPKGTRTQEHDKYGTSAPDSEK
jgi:hypothetical protein